MAYLDSGDARLFYTDEGAGPPLILVHGWLCDSFDWSWMIPHLREHFRVIAYDRRGEGRSTPGTGQALAQQVGDVMAIIEQLGIEQPIVVGHSLGGAIVSSLDVEHPGVARGIVALDPPYASDATTQAGADALAPMLEQESGRAAVKGLWQMIAYRPATPEWLRTIVDRRIDAVPIEFLHSTFVGVWQDETEICRMPQAEAYLARRTCPVLAIHSTRKMAAFEEDTFSNPASEAIDWPGSGHWINIERPVELATVIREWAAALPTPIG